MAQIEELSQSISNSIEQARGLLEQYALGRQLIDSLPRSLTPTDGSLIARVTHFPSLDRIYLGYSIKAYPTIK